MHVLSAYVVLFVGVVSVLFEASFYPTQRQADAGDAKKVPYGCKYAMDARKVRRKCSGQNAMIEAVSIFALHMLRSCLHFVYFPCVAFVVFVVLR